MMNKLTKGSIAAGAGLVLLLGGAGTFMSWNDEANIGGGTVAAGQLNVEAGEGTWAVNEVQGVDIANYQIVPGDTVVYTVPMTVTAEGDNLQASLRLTNGSINPVNGTDADMELAAQLADTATFELTPNDPETTQLDTTDAVSNVYAFDAANGPLNETMTVTTTLVFPEGDRAENGAMSGEVSLDGMSVSFDQVLGSGTETVE